MVYERKELRFIATARTLYGLSTIRVDGVLKRFYRSEVMIQAGSLQQASHGC